MKTTRHTSLAVIVILVVLIVLLTAVVETAPEIIIPPSSETVYSGDTKEFTCHTRNANYAEWKLNGTTSLISSNDVTVSSDGAIATGFNTTLTIKARLEYHGLVIECVAVMVDGGTVVRMSKNATLMVQGLLDSPCNVTAKSDSDSIFLSWRPPYSLNVTGVEPDIWYNIIITNITDNMPVPCSDCHNLTQRQYTFTTTNPSPCHKYSFTIISLNGAGEGGRSEPVEAFFRSAPDQVDGNEVKVERDMIRKSSGQSINITLPPSECLGNEPDECIVYCEGVNSSCGSYISETLTEENSVLRFTVDNTELPPNCSYTAIIETINNFGRVNSTKFNFNAVDSTKHTSSITVTPTPSGEPEIEMQNMQPHVIISALVVTITITTTASSTVIVLIVIFRKRRKGKLFNLPQSVEDNEKGRIVDVGCGSDSNSSSTTSPPHPTEKKNPGYTEGVTYSVLLLHDRSVKPPIDNETPSQYAIISFPNVPSPVPAEASDTQLTEPEKPKTVLISPENVKAMLWPVAKKWKKIGEALGQSEDILDEVYTNNETDECCMENAIELWVKYHGLSWEKLATVLRGVGEEALANKCQAHHDVNDSLSEEAPPLPPPYVPRGQEIHTTSETPFQQTTLLGEEKYFTKAGNVAAEQTSQQLMECGKMNIVEGENGKVLFATDGYTPPPLNDNDEDAIRRKDQMETTIEKSFEPFTKSSQRFVSNCGRPSNEEVNAKSRCPMFTNSPCVSVPESYKRPSQLVAFNTYFNAQLTVLPPNEIHTPEQHSCGPVMQVTEEEMPPTAKYCFTPFSLKKLENDPKSDTCEIDCLKTFESSDSYEMEFDCMQSSQSSPSEDEDTQETEPSVAKMEGGQENESSLPEDKDAQETESNLPEDEDAQETESSLPEMGGGQMKISDDVPDTPGTQLHTYFPTEQMFGLAAVVSIVWSAMKIFNWKYAPWDRGRTVLSCLWKDSGRNGCPYVHCN